MPADILYTGQFNSPPSCDDTDSLGLVLGEVFSCWVGRLASASDAGQDPRRGTRSHPAVILAKGDVADVEHAIFDLPMLTCQAKQAGRISSVWRA